MPAQQLLPSTPLSREVTEYIQNNAYSANTLKAYRSDLHVFTLWLGERPFEGARTITEFFQDVKGKKSFSTLSRYKSALAKAYPEILQAPALKLYFKALWREKAARQHHSAPLLDADFLSGFKEIKSSKYRFLLALQYKGAFRISEVLGLRWKDIVSQKKGLAITLERSKTSLFETTIGVKDGEILVTELYEIYRFSQGDPSPDELIFHLSRVAVTGFIKRHFGVQYSTHSLRSGHITSSILRGVPLEQIMKTSRHKSYDTVIENYYNPTSIFSNTSALV